MDKTSKVIIPVDFTSTIAKVAKYAVSMAEMMGAQVVFFHVVNDFRGYDMLLVHPSFAVIKQELKDKTEKKMAELVAEYTYLKGGVSGKVVIGKAAEEIVAFAAQEKADMIIIGTRGIKGLEELLIGSTAKQVVNTAACPVLTFNPFKLNK